MEKRNAQVQLYPKHNNKDTISKLNGLVADSIDFVEGDPKTIIKGASNLIKLETLKTTLVHNLLEKTNIDEVFEIIKSDYSSNFFLTALHRIKFYSYEPTFDNFINIINELIDEKIKNEINTFIIYIPARLEIILNRENSNNFKDILHSVMEISLEHPPENIFEQIKIPKFRELFILSPTVFKLKIDARDTGYALKKIRKKLNLFFGVVSLSHTLFVDSISYPYTGPISNNPLIAWHLITNETSDIIIPNRTQRILWNPEIINECNSILSKEIWIINDRPENYERIINFIKTMNKNEKNINSFLEDILILYFKAITENDLDICFLKFWIIIERIIKISHNKKINFRDELNKIFKGSYFEDYINELYDKRNDFVHEFKSDYISQSDRNLSKLIAENLILDFFDENASINNYEDLRKRIYKENF